MSEKVPPAKYEKILSYKLALAKANGFKNMFEFFMAQYDDDTPEYTADGFRRQMFDLWEEIRPMYNKLHAYVRIKLRNRTQYEGLIGKCGYIPAYEMWGSLDPITKPFPDAPSLDPTKVMKKRNYTVLQMFQESDKFFTNLGFPPMTPTFWNKSMFERPADGRQVVCHASALDMCLGQGSQDFRVKLCGKVDFDQLKTIHHEMGHVAYYQQYANHNLVFRRGANQGFHEAIGDALALSVVTPRHLQCELGLELGLDSGICDSVKVKGNEGSPSVSETDINFLYITALKNLPNIPFYISADTWSWEAFEGKLTPDQFNTRWWELMSKNRGVQPPADNKSPKLFDPAGEFHLAMDVDYLRYFISAILKFQFYEAMCIAAGQYDPNVVNTSPLFRCDFSGSKEAGKLLMNMMKLGSSKEWPTALEALTGSRNISVALMKHYFQPLMDYIDVALMDSKEEPGFGGDNC